VETKRRRDVLGILQCDADVRGGEKEFKNLPGFPGGVIYAKKPQNRYQKWLRRGLEENAGDLTGHYTTRWKLHIIEAVANVPLQALADHRGIPCVAFKPRILKPTQIWTRFFSLSGQKPKKRIINWVNISNFLHDVFHSSKFSVLYGRLDPDGYFKCAVTTLSPVVKNQWPLHPSVGRFTRAALSQAYEF
jgi:DNA (cytosine-5)-methyltransferase 1